ncbi:MAG TPA: pentapeptide repeat-containing protein [Gammaproteobacteria bacterium]|nr:pentapeptide repeat-containing protein [Gammaproteobacteria bacterium]
MNYHQSSISSSLEHLTPSYRGLSAVSSSAFLDPANKSRDDDELNKIAAGQRNFWLQTLTGMIILFFSMMTHAANPDDLAKLTKQDQKVGLDLSNADLRGYQFVPGKIDLQNANLSNADLTNVNLEKMDLRGADLNHANLTNAILNHADLSYANLSHANLTNTQLIEVNLTNASLKYATLIGANFSKSNFTKANFTCANFNGANISGTNFSETIISSASFTNTTTTNILHYDSVEDRRVECI